MRSKLVSQNFNIALFIWLITLTSMVFAIIIIGGLTRLTDSGLSMVDWRPILGTLPPLNNNQWLEVFELYKKSPEYIYINKNMSLNDFKYIFWWEWFHRFFARLIGLVFIVPYIYFVLTNKINKKLNLRFLIIFLFGIIQAIVGWWMVKSGLTDNPYVSPYRLTFHLINALIIFSLLLWTSMDYFYTKKINIFTKLNLYDHLILISIYLTLITIISGGFMAGSNAGQSYNTYPLMNGNFIPEDYFLKELGLLNFFENTIAINFNHRWMGTITFIYSFSLFFFFALNNSINIPKIFSYLVLLTISLQFILGILALLSNVFIAYASLHQTNSILLFSTLLIFYHQSKVRKFVINGNIQQT